MAGSTDFLLSIQTRLQGNAATELARIEGQLRSGVARYREYQRASETSAKALESVSAKLVDVRSKMAAAMSEGNERRFWSLAAAANKLGAQQDALRKRAADATAGMDRQKALLGGLRDKFDTLNGAQAKHVEGGNEVGKGLKKLGGPLGKIGDFVDDASEGWAKLSNEVGVAGAAVFTGAAAMAAAAVVVVALTAVVLAGAAAFGKWALTVADAKRSSDLTTEALSSTSAGFARNARAIDETTRATGIASDRLQAIVSDLNAAHVAGADIPAALRAIATQEAALGNSSGTAALIERLRSGQTSASALAAEMDSKLGGVVERRMRSLDGLASQLKRSMSDIFGDLPIEPVLEGFQRIVSLLDTQTESGRALKAIVGSLFAPLGNAAPLFIQVERFLLGMEIAALKVAIVVKGIGKRFGDVLPSVSGFVDAGDAGQVAFAALAVAAIGAAVALGAIAAVLAVVGIAAAATFLPMALVVAAPLIALGMLAIALYGVYSAAERLRALDWAQIGAAIVDGLLMPIRDPGAVAAAFSIFGQNAVNALKEKLGIHSPSRVFEELGNYSAEGFAVGLESGAPKARASLSSLASGPIGSGSGTRSITLEIGQIVIQGVDGAEEMVERLGEKIMERIVTGLDEVALSGGAGVTP